MYVHKLDLLLQLTPSMSEMAMLVMMGAICVTKLPNCKMSPWYISLSLLGFPERKNALHKNQNLKTLNLVGSV